MRYYRLIGWEREISPFLNVNLLWRLCMRLSNKNTYKGMSPKEIRLEMSNLVSLLYKKSDRDNPKPPSYWDDVRDVELLERLDTLEECLLSSLDDCLDREFVVNMENLML